MMEFLQQRLTDLELFGWDEYINYWFFLAMMALFAFELIVMAFKKAVTWNLIGDSITNFITLFAYRFIGGLIYILFYLTAFFWVYENFSITQLPLTWMSLLGCILLADVIYYWEHRFMHVCGLGWATHTVHHSSPHFNISVAYRFGPLDGFFPFFFHLPLIMLGFHPFMVFLAEALVQLYQTALHTQMVKKLPRPIEYIMNTPSHHRVHHATNSKYIDKNYAGIFIIWDRMFGTFAEEDEKVKFGVYPRINSVNPFTVFFHGFTKLGKQLWEAPSWSYRFQLLIRPPIWAWEQEQKRKREAAAAEAKASP
ncbi:sterol desaturase family protein [uncultured Pseudoteredinibacter sp.]|uniref:sterol desaturase family protein n=1 Tax=uncultured Pseudoteredinibacter sp. TaxID=1641701 RepID=UPI0026370049|nr:sterol desaturase family protein [uncultured Pseudoteredinibacter sp.]